MIDENFFEILKNVLIWTLFTMVEGTYEKQPFKVLYNVLIWMIFPSP